MSDYEPLDLTRWCDSAVDESQLLKPLPTGPHYLRGIPFLFSSTTDGETQVLAFGSGGYSQPVDIPILSSVHWLIIGHCLLESKLFEGEPVGRHIADYRFIYANGIEITIPIRERFEISLVPTGWGQLPFVALSDTQPYLVPRYAGRWDESGIRLAEAR